MGTRSKFNPRVRNPRDPFEVQRKFSEVGGLLHQVQEYLFPQQEPWPWDCRFFLGNQFAATDIYTMERPNVELMLWWGWLITDEWDAVHRAETLAIVAAIGGEVMLDYEADQTLAIERITAEDANVPAGLRRWWFAPAVSNDINLGDLKLTDLALYDTTVAAIGAQPLPAGYGVALDFYMGVGGTFDGWWLRVAERIKVWRRRGVPLAGFISHREAADPMEALLDVDVFRAMAQAVHAAGCDVVFWQDGASDAYSVIEPYWVAYLEVARGDKPGFQNDTVLVSPNGHYWEITVDNAGVVTTTDLGTSPP